MLIVGSRGAGKTWMLGQVFAALGPESVTIRLTASKALASIPCGAVNARIGANLARGSDYYEVLNGLLAQINDAVAASRKVYLMVDNAEHLDAQSAAIIMQVVMATEAKLILVDQPGGHHSHLRELWRDGHLVRFELAPLQIEDVRKYLEEFLAGPVSRTAAEYLTSRSGGNPLVLQGLVIGAQEEGSLRKVNNVWLLDHPRGHLAAESWEFLQMDINHLPDDSRRLIEILALVGPLPLDVVLDITSADAVDNIQLLGLVEIVPGDGLTLRLARAATAASIRAAVPVGRSRQLLDEVQKTLPLHAQSSLESTIEMTRWMVDCGVNVADEQIVAAAVGANQLMRHGEALQLSALRVHGEHSAALLAERAHALINRNSLEEARHNAWRAFDLATTAAVAARAFQAINSSHKGRHDYESHLERALAGYEQRFGSSELEHAPNLANLDIQLVLAAADVHFGRTGGAKERIEKILRHPLAVRTGDAVLAKSLLSEVLRAEGDFSQAVAMAGEVIAELEHPDGFNRPDIAILAYTRAVAALIYDGAWELAGAALQPDVFVNPDLVLHIGGLRDIAAGMMACRQGHIDEAQGQLESAVRLLDDYDPWGVQVTALSALAYCQSMRGDSEGAEARLEQLATLDAHTSTFHHLECASYAAAAQYMTGHNDLGLARLRKVQRECAAAGYLGIELTALSLLLRLGDEQAANRMCAVTAAIESRSKQFFMEWADAMATQDPVKLERASSTAQNYGFDLLSVELASHAQRKFSDDGKSQRSRQIANKVVTLREQMPGLYSPVFQSLDRPKMTQRELQIALLVAQGHSNNVIAEKLHVSLRTVEGHLYRTFIKLDIQSRDQLAHYVSGSRDLDVAEASHS